MTEEGKDPMKSIRIMLLTLHRHFYAYEQPDLLVRDLREMFGKGGGAYGVISKRGAY